MVVVVVRITTRMFTATIEEKGSRFLVVVVVAVVVIGVSVVVVVVACTLTHYLNRCACSAALSADNPFCLDHLNCTHPGRNLPNASMFAF